MATIQSLPAPPSATGRAPGPGRGRYPRRHRSVLPTGSSPTEPDTASRLTSALGLGDVNIALVGLLTRASSSELAQR